MVGLAASFGETNYFASSGAPGQSSWAVESFWSLNRTPKSTNDDDVVLDNDHASGGAPHNFALWRLHGNYTINSLTFSLSDVQTSNPASLYADALTAGTSKDLSLTLLSGNLTRSDTAFGGDIVVGATNERNTGKMLLSTLAAQYTITNNKAGSNFIINAVVQGDGTKVEIAGPGTVQFGGGNTYTGNTTVSAPSTFHLAEGGSMVFVIGAGAGSNQLNGAGTVQLDGVFAFDLSRAGKREGDKWQVVDVAKLGETFGASFKVDGFTKANGIWVNGDYQFSPATGVLSVRRAGQP